MRKVILIGLVQNHHSMYNYIINNVLVDFDSILLITKSTISKNIMANNSSVKLIINDSVREDFVIKKNLNLFQTNTLVIIDEYYGLFYRLSNIQLNNVIMIIHNFNKWFSFIPPFKNFKLFIDHFFRFNILKKVDSYIAISPLVKSKIKKVSSKNVHFLPFEFSNKNVKKSREDNLIKIVIPGMVDSKRRDYNSLLNSIFDFLKQNNKCKIRFIFLGRIIKENESLIFEKIININNKYCDIIEFYEEYISSEKFNEKIISCDYILSNLKSKIEKQGYNEYYGKTKESGISYLLYKYSKPGIIPNWQITLNDLDNQLIKYSNKTDLKNILIKINKNQINTLKLIKNAELNKFRFNKYIKEETLKFRNYIYK